MPRNTPEGSGANEAQTPPQSRLEGAVVERFRKFHVSLCEQVTDSGYSIHAQGDTLRLTSSTTNDGYARLNYSTGRTTINENTWAKKREFVCRPEFTFGDLSNEPQIYISLGDAEYHSDYVAFRYESQNLYGEAGGRSTQLVNGFASANTDRQVKLRCVHIPNERVQFFVNGELKGELFEGVPQGDSNQEGQHTGMWLRYQDGNDTDFGLSEFRYLQYP